MREVVTLAPQQAAERKAQSGRVEEAGLQGPSRKQAAEQPGQAAQDPVGHERNLLAEALHLGCCGGGRRPRTEAQQRDPVAPPEQPELGVRSHLVPEQGRAWEARRDVEDAHGRKPLNPEPAGASSAIGGAFLEQGRG